MENLPYINLELLGSGPWGRVFKAHDPQLERTVVLKVIPSRDEGIPVVTRLAEARAAAAVDHPHVCPIHQVHTLENGSLVLVLAWCPGGSLETRLLDQPLTGPEALDVARDCARGLQALHEAGIIHRDLKPGNILLDGEDRPRLADFGLAGMENIPSGGPSVLAGTLPYMAPEVLNGSPADARSDLWALGAVFFEMVTGHPPFRGDYEAALRYAIAFDEPQAPPAQSDEATLLVHAAALRCLAKDPARRPASAAELIQDLDAVPVEPRPHRSRRGLVAGLALALAFLVGLGMIKPWQNGPTGFSPAQAQGAVILPFQHAGPDPEGGRLAAGLARQAGESMLLLEAEMPDWWFVPPKRAILREMDNLTRAHGLSGATHAVAGRLESIGQEALKLTLRLDGVNQAPEAAPVSTSLMISRQDLAGWQTEVPRAIARLLGAEVPADTDRRLRQGGTHSSDAFRHFLAGLGHISGAHARQDTAAAAAALRAAIAEDPNFALAWWALGENERLQGGDAGRDRARERWRHSLELEPALPLALGSLAHSYLDEGQPRKARELLLDLAAQRPDLFLTRIRLGEAAAALGDSAMADESFRAAIALHPGDAVGPACLGAFFFNYCGDIPRAAEAFRLAARDAPGDSENLLFLGACHFSIDEMDQAAEAFERSISLDRNPQALEYLAVIRYYQGKFAQGAALVEELLTEDDARHEVWGLLGQCLEEVKGRRQDSNAAYREAARLCRLSLERQGTNPQAQASLGIYQAKLGQDSAARASLEAAAAAQAVGWETMLFLTHGFEILGDRDSALRWLSRLLEMNYPAFPIDRSPDFAAMRTDPRYQALMDPARKTSRVEPALPDSITIRNHAGTWQASADTIDVLPGDVLHFQYQSTSSRDPLAELKSSQKDFFIRPGLEVMPGATGALVVSCDARNLVETKLDFVGPSIHMPIIIVRVKTGILSGKRDCVRLTDPGQTGTMARPDFLEVEPGQEIVLVMDDTFFPGDTLEMEAEPDSFFTRPRFQTASGAPTVLGVNPRLPDGAKAVIKLQGIGPLTPIIRVKVKTGSR